MFTADQCSSCSPTSTCGFSCYFYWHRCKPIRKPRVPSTRESRGQFSLENQYPKPDETSSAKPKQQSEVIDLCGDDEESEAHGGELDQNHAVPSTQTRGKKRHRQVSPSFESNLQRSQDNLEDDVTRHSWMLVNEGTDHDGRNSLERQGTVPEQLQKYQTDIETPFATISSSYPETWLQDLKNIPKTDVSPSKKLPDAFSCIDRKRIIVFNRPETVTTAMQTWYTTTLSLFDPFRSIEDCWFHPSPPLPKKTSESRSSNSQQTSSPQTRSKTTISKKFHWTDSCGRHSVHLNFGIVSKLLTRTMSNQQKDGFITKGWHLSHLCGNWTCLNPKHATVEPGYVNLARNNCFSHRSGCTHIPPCMKEKKVPIGLGPAQDEVSFGFDDDGFEDWWVRFDDDDDDDHDNISNNVDMRANSDASSESHSVSSEALKASFER